MTTPDHDETLRVDTDARSTRRYETDEQFAPGTLVAERYRISSILGKGGMGEVYRADDIKLGQTVALKFLPAKLALDQKLLDRLHDEVRLGRQITHPNVCRIYDIGEWGDAHFVAMEYVDGEDLARLLHRIGRLPHDKAVEITRDIAAGLAAAHAKGILHRDLKPANVMIDSHGDARITDFGLALTADDEQRDIAGTPAYMAPELLDGAPATIQSDLYALGLVMYEIFTGKRLFTGRDKSSEVTTPSSVIRDIEPTVERVILRCLERDPALRPRSAREIITSLPGGDPLAAAMAAGETPSPKLIAAAGSEGTLRPRAAWAILGAAIALLAFVGWYGYVRAVDRYVDVQSPEVLRDRASAILRRFRIPAEGTPLAAFAVRRRYTQWLQKRAEHASGLGSGPPLFVYRLEYGVGEIESSFAAADVIAPGRTTIEIDTTGRLASLLVSPRRDDAAARPPDWNALLAAAGFTPATLTPTAPHILPPAPFDARAAWTGTYPNNSTPVRVEAAAWHGVPVFLQIRGAWDEADDVASGIPFENPALKIVFGTVIGFIILASLLLAARNLRLRRGDRQGAFRLATFMFGLSFAVHVLKSSFAGGIGDVLALVLQLLGASLVDGVLTFMLYIAVEPYIRRRWPDKLISWVRLLTGRARDPMVGRDVLIGIAAGAGHSALATLSAAFTVWSGQSAEVRAVGDLGDLEAVLNVRHAIESMLDAMGTGIAQGFLYIGLLVVLSMVLRRRALTVGVFFAIVLTVYIVATAGQWGIVPFVAAVAALEVFIMVRCGLLAFSTMMTVFFTIQLLTPILTASWAIWLVAFPFLVTTLAALWAFRTSLGGQSPWHPALLDD